MNQILAQTKLAVNAEKMVIQVMETDIMNIGHPAQMEDYIVLVIQDVDSVINQSLIVLILEIALHVLDSLN
jgi:hypothetical protein